MLEQPVVIAFAGAVGSSKTPIASFLSWNLELPVYNNDAVRSEVQEDLLAFDEAEHRRRRDERLEHILQNQTSFICDASVDREWDVFQVKLKNRHYRCFLISLDLSKNLLLKLYIAKSYNETAKRIDQLLSEHQNFITKYDDQINLHISDEDFPKRLDISLLAVKDWLNK